MDRGAWRCYSPLGKRAGQGFEAEPKEHDPIPTPFLVCIMMCLSNVSSYNDNQLYVHFLIPLLNFCLFTKSHHLKTPLNLLHIAFHCNFCKIVLKCISITKMYLFYITSVGYTIVTSNFQT